MKIDFKKPIIGLDGQPLTDGEGKQILLGQTVGNALAAMTEGDYLKFRGWGQQMYDGKTVEMDQSDVNTFKTFLQFTKNLSALTKSQAHEVVDAAGENK